jgi:hypothetical protein
MGEKRQRLDFCWFRHGCDERGLGFVQTLMAMESNSDGYRKTVD